MENKKNERSLIHESLMKIVNYYNNSDSNQSELKIDDSLKQYFCDEQCYHKFLRVIEKLKTNSIDMSKINWNDSLDNKISQIVSYYYNLGLSQYSESNTN